ncbi:hypothetical protein GA0115246_103413, partial [Streptomyces sp. SolWspMP-sol7th]
MHTAQPGPEATAHTAPETPATPARTRALLLL